MTATDTVERRIVTVLFADLVGFTALSEQFDAEDVAQIQDRYFAAVRETIGRYGGRLEKFIGDAAMALFGVPRARDDDAQRAVRAGLALVHAVQQIGAELGLDENALQLRVGVNTGEVVVAAGGEDEGRATGDTVNTAARLQTAAPAGGVLIGPTTALSVAHMAVLDVPQALGLKGKVEPVPARLVLGFLPQPSREQAMGDLRAPTVGREAELERLAGALDETRQGISARVTVIAPPGVGKSRLLREFAERLERGEGDVVIWRTRARSDASSVFEPIAMLLSEALEETSLESALADAGVEPARARVVAEAVTSLIAPRGTGTDERQPTEERQALFEAWLDALDALAGDAAQVWLVEDVHWAGDDVLSLLTLAGARPARHGRLVVATARPSLLESSPDWVESGRTLELATLPETDARQLVTALVGDALPPELTDRIADRSDGNCLFIEELLRTWASVGTLVRDDDDRWRLAVAADEVTLPQSVQSIYAAQLDDLPADARRVARRASVAGRRFPVRALDPLEAAANGLEPLQRRALLAGPVPAPILGDEFAYRHALLRDAGYASLARAERARLHVRMARWLEETAGPRGGELAERIALHYSAALDSAPALATELGDGLGREQVRELAAEWFERAGRNTLALSAHAAARQLIKRSIELTSEQSTLEQARRWERLGDATAFAADMDEGAAAYQRAISLYRRALSAGSEAFDAGSATLGAGADRLERGGAELQRRLNELGETLGVGGLGAELDALTEGAAELRAGAKELQQAKRDYEREMATAGLARATAALGDVWYQQLRFAEAEQLAADTLAEVGAEDPESTARLLIARAVGSLGASGPTPQAEVDLERALALARQQGNAEVELKALSELVGLRQEAGRGGRESWHAVSELADRLGDWGEAFGARLNAAMMLLDSRAADALPQIVEARELAEAHGRREDAGWADYLESEVAFISGDWERAMAAGLRALDLAEANAYHRLGVRSIHVLVPVAAVRGDRVLLERAAAFYKSLEVLASFPDSPYARIVEPAQGLELGAAGLREAAVPDVDSRIAAFMDKPGGGSWSSAIDRVFRSWLEAGDVGGAGRAYAQMSVARADWTSVQPLSEGMYRLLGARLAERRGNASTAAEDARAALAHFREASAPWWMAKAMRLLERVGAADDVLRAEVTAIERRLGAVHATA